MSSLQGDISVPGHVDGPMADVGVGAACYVFTSVSMRSALGMERDDDGFPLYKDSFRPRGKPRGKDPDLFPKDRPQKRISSTTPSTPCTLPAC